MKSIISLFQRIARRSRVVVGLGFVIISIIGVGAVIQFSTPGDPVILATRFLSAGTVITEDHITAGRLSSATLADVVDATDLVGHALGVDVGKGEIVTARMLEPTSSTRVELSVPLGVAPPSGVARGSVVALWSLDTEGLVPPVAVANTATVMSLDEGNFGGETIATVLVNPADVDRVLAVLGTTRLLVATSSETS